VKIDQMNNAVVVTAVSSGQMDGFGKTLR